LILLDQSSFYNRKAGKTGAKDFMTPIQCAATYSVLSGLSELFKRLAFLSQTGEDSVLSNLEFL
jgi:hypothetical protein